MTNATVSDATGKASEAASKAGEVATTAKEQATTVAAQGKEEVKSVAQEASQHARRMMTESRNELRTQADTQTTRVVEGLRQISQQLQSMAGSVDDSSSPVVSLVGQAASTTDRMASRLDEGGIDGLLDDTRRLARNRPGMFLLGALGAGMVAGRMLKGTKSAASSAPDALVSDGYGSSVGATWANGDTAASYSYGEVLPPASSASTGTISTAAGLPVEADPIGDYSGNIGDPTAVEQAGMPLGGGLPGTNPEDALYDRNR
jgi:hypothetical protein